MFAVPTLNCSVFADTLAVDTPFGLVPDPLHAASPSATSTAESLIPLEYMYFIILSA
jgi:hypothetical protein